MNHIGLARQLTAALLATASLLIGAHAHAAEPTGPSTDAGVIDIGVQPNTNMHALTTAMLHDPQLHQDLHQHGLRLRSHAYQDGNAMADQFSKGHLEVAFMGNLPSLRAIFDRPTLVLGLTTQYHSVLIAAEGTRLDNLRGKKVAYPPGTSSHLGLLRALEIAHLSLQDIQAVAMPLPPARMTTALAAGQVDAIAIWEPRHNDPLSPQYKTIFRAVETNWVLLSQTFVDAHPEASLALAAAYVRAVNWLRLKSAHVEQTARWLQADQQAFNGRPSVTPLSRVMEQVRSTLLNSPNIPGLPKQIEGQPPLLRELRFLKSQEALPPSAAALSEAQREARLRMAFTHDLLQRVQAAPRRYALNVFRHGQEPTP
jgi:ABC-type nitrate/sulfonate/bicarbonate transport system substrate-binding protein